jgi:polyphosphate kinase 2 (PPK2 family)
VARPQAAALLTDGVERRPAAAGDHGIWARYREINDWKRYLPGNGIRVVNVLLNLSRREQAKRFLKRIGHPDKNWKSSPSDVREPCSWRTTSGPSKPC